MIKDEEIGKYKKRTESNTSKSNKKAKHKHNYIECLCHISKERERYCHASYCDICGKVGNISFWETEKTDNGYYRTLNNDEILEKYKDLKIKEVYSEWDEYFALEEE